MSAIRLRATSKGLEVRVDDETPISDEPITLQVLNGHIAPPTFLSLTTNEAQALAYALIAAVNDARRDLENEKRQGIRR